MESGETGFLYTNPNKLSPEESLGGKTAAGHHSFFNGLRAKIQDTIQLCSPAIGRTPVSLQRWDSKNKLFGSVKDITELMQCK